MSAPAVRSFTDERGASAVEYSTLVVLIAAVVVGTVTVLGGQVSDLFDSATGVFLMTGSECSRAHACVGDASREAGQ